MGFGAEELFEFEHFDAEVFGIVVPADDEIAAGGVVIEAAGCVFELDADAAPEAIFAFAFCFAIGEAGSDHFDEEAERFGHHAEEHDDALFVGGRVEKFVAANGIAEGEFGSIGDEGRIERQVHCPAAIELGETEFVGVGLVAAACDEIGIATEKAEIGPL